MITSIIIFIWLIAVTALVIRMYLIIDNRLDDIEEYDKICRDNERTINNNFTQLKKTITLQDKKIKNCLTREQIIKEFKQLLLTQQTNKK